MLIPLVEEPLVQVKVDIDSLYYGADSLEELVNMTGKKCQYTLNSVTDHFYSSTGSRFKIQCGGLNNYPISSRGFRTKEISFHRLPNVILFKCSLNSAPAHPMAIYISFTGVERIRQTNMFYQEEMSVINTALNLTVFTMKSFSTTDVDLLEYADQISRLPVFETKVKGQFKKNVKDSKSFLGPKAMLLFASTFDTCLKSLQGETGLGNCLNPKFNGMRYDDGKCLLEENNVILAIKSLNKGHYFTANLAGIKNVFKELPTLRLLLNEEYYLGSDVSLDEFDESPDVFEKVQTFVDESLKRLYDVLRTRMVEIVPGEESIYYFDVGVELSSLDPDLDLVTLMTPAYTSLDTILQQP
jgi:hypothetical protein